MGVDGAGVRVSGVSRGSLGVSRVFALKGAGGQGLGCRSLRVGLGFRVVEAELQKQNRLSGYLREQFSC